MLNHLRLRLLVFLPLFNACGGGVETQVPTAAQPPTQSGTKFRQSGEELSLGSNSNTSTLTDYEAIVHNSVFNCDFYRAKYSDLSSFTCEQAQAHWVTFGARRGRTGHKLFRVNEYLMMYPDLQNRFGTDLVAAIRHFARSGASDGRAGRLLFSPRVFDCSFYIATYMNEVNPAPTCDAAKSDFADTIEANFERAGNLVFDPHEYVALYPNMKVAYGSIVARYFDHFVTQGFAANRAGNFFTVPTYFNCDYYRNQSPDFWDKDCIWLRTHWMQFGLQQGLQASRLFSIRDYLNANPLLKNRFGDNFWLAWHYKVRFESNTPYSLKPLTSAGFSKDSRTLFNITAGPGIDPTGKADSTVAIANVINNAVNFAKTKSDSKVWVKFPAGTFRLGSCLAWDSTPPATSPYPFAKPGACFAINGATNLLISGEGSSTLFLNNNPQAGLFEVQNSTGVYLEGFAIDYDPLPFVQGIVSSVAVTGSTVEVTVDTASGISNDLLALLQKYLAVGSHIPMSDRGFPWLRKRNSFSMFRYDSVTQSSNQLKFVVKNEYSLNKIPNQIAVNDGFVYTARQGAAPALQFFNSSNIGLHNVFVFASPGVATVWSTNSGEIVIDGLVVRRRSDTPMRYLSTNAGGINASNNRSALTIQNSYFESMGDDSINIYSFGSVVSGISPDKKVLTIVGREPQINDTLQFVDPSNMAILGTGTVAGTKPLGRGVRQVTLESVIEGINTNNGTLPPLPPLGNRAWTNTAVFNLSNAGAGSVVTNNIFGPHRARNVLMKSPGGTISNNIFLMADMSAVLVGASTYGFIEGPIPERISVEHNKLWMNGGAGPAIVFGNEPLGPSVAPAATNVVLRNNTFLTCSNSCVEFSGVSTGTISNNVFDAFHSQKRLGRDPVVNIRDKNVTGISQSRNTINDRRRETPP